jgi:hypothetical protein
MIWDAARLYAELGRQRTRLEDQGGGSGGGEDTAAGEVGGARPACGGEGYDSRARGKRVGESLLTTRRRLGVAHGEGEAPGTPTMSRWWKP